MTGTDSQVEWAGRIRPQVQAEFERVAKAFQAVALKQSGQDLVDTQTVLAILEDKRAEAMAMNEAGYFIRDWQEMKDQVRKTIAADPRFEAIQASRKTRTA